MNFSEIVSDVIGFFIHLLPTWMRPVDKGLLVLKGRTVQVVVPRYSLAKGSLVIEPLPGMSSEQVNAPECQAEMYQLMQKMAKIWDQTHADYLVYRKVDSTRQQIKWEVVPTQRDGGDPQAKYIKVIRRMAFGGFFQTQNQQKEVANRYAPFVESILSKPLTEKEPEVEDKHTDPFCQPERIQAQLLYEGKSVNIIYNSAPVCVGKSHVHLLFVPKEHRTGFSDLNEREYLETAALTEKMIKGYREKGFSDALILHKTGIHARQTVFHWHQHIILTEANTNRLWTKFEICKKMIHRQGALPEDTLKQRVTELKTDLAKILQA